MGKVNAAACTQALILNWPVKLIVNAGVAGAIREPLERGDVCIATDLVQFDLDASGLNQNDAIGPKLQPASYRCAEWAVDALLQAARCVETARIVTCRLATGDQFMGDQANRDRVVRRFDACAVDTEGAAIARICFLNGIDCAVVHTIADVFEDATRELGRQYLPVAAQTSAKIVLKFLEN